MGAASTKNASGGHSVPIAILYSDKLTFLLFLANNVQYTQRNHTV